MNHCTFLRVCLGATFLLGGAAYAQPGPAQSGIFNLTTAGQSAFGAELELASEGPRTIDLTDIDLDGDADLAIGAREGTILRSNTDGLGTWSGALLWDADLVVSTLADLDGDGVLDLVGGRDFNNGMQWRRNLGALVFGPAQLIAPGISVELLQPADLDRDGDLDLVLAVANGDVAWTANTDGQGSFGPLQVIGANATATALQVADIDGDADDDIIWSSWMQDAVWCARGLGNATYGAPAPLTAQGQGRVADVDGDGHADLVSGAGNGGALIWQRNTQGDGSLSAPQAISPVATDFTRMLVRDLDADGDLDLVTASALSDELAWFENIDGQGSFGERQVIGVNVEDASVLATGDIDGDGDAEVFAGSTAQNRVVWYENLTYATGRIMGRVYNDIDQDGVFNGNDHGLACVPVTVAGVGTVLTNHSGTYWIEVPTGSFTVEAPVVPGWTATTPTVRTASLFLNGNSAHTDFGRAADGAVVQVQPTLTPGAMRCNEQVRYWIDVANTGNTVCDVELALDLDDLSAFVGAMPEATLQGTIAHWTFPRVQPTHHRSVELIVQLAGPDHLGAVLHDVLTATARVNGVVQAAPVASSDAVLLCACDPNDKQVLPVGTGVEHWTPMGSLLTYTIRFQNVGNAPAAEVEVLDQLDEDLDAASLQVVSTSHVLRTVVGPDGLVRFRFEHIQLPDSASDPLGSQGHVTFTIRHTDLLPEATEVHNAAAIFFDLNPAITTNTVLNTLTYGTTGIDDATAADQVLRVYPNPVTDEARVVIAAEAMGRADLVLTDAMGRPVRAWSMPGDSITLQRDGLPAGLYILRVAHGGVEHSARVVFQ